MSWGRSRDGDNYYMEWQLVIVEVVSGYFVWDARSVEQAPMNFRNYERFYALRSFEMECPVSEFSALIMLR